MSPLAESDKTLTFLEKMTMIRGHLEIIDDQLQQIFDIQLGILNKEWINAIRKLEEGYDSVQKYVKLKLQSGL